MKSYYLYLKEGQEVNFLGSLDLLYENQGVIIVKYAYMSEPSHFIGALQANCQRTQRYYLTRERSLPKKTVYKDYLILGINCKAKMICFTEPGDSKWLAENKLKLLEPGSFYLNWNKEEEFDVEWV